MEADEAPEDRLEAALERIAKIVDVRSAASVRIAASPFEALPDQVATDFVNRLDRIIDTLREALGK